VNGCGVSQGVALLLEGGLAYTAGVPFFVKSTRTLGTCGRRSRAPTKHVSERFTASVGVPDHTIWHVLVMIGSFLHFVCIYNYVVPDLSGADVCSINLQDPGSYPHGAQKLDTV